MLFLIYVYFLFFIFIGYILNRENSIINNKYIALFFQINMIFISIYIIAITDINYTDRIIYSSKFFEIKNNLLIDSINNIKWEPLFIALVKLISAFTSNVIMFYIMLHSIFLLFLLTGLSKIFNNYKVTTLTLFIYLNYTFYFGYTLNGLRQGLAMSLLILAIGYALRNNKFKMLISCLIAFLFHNTAIIIALIILTIYFWKKIKISYLVILYTILSALYVTNINESIFGVLPLGDFEVYTQRNLIQTFGGTNKLTYLIFNTSFLLLFLYMFRSSRFKNDIVYQFLMKSYILFSSFYLMFGFIAYANRIASYSWFIIPILLGYLIYQSKNSLLNLGTLILILLVGSLTAIPDQIASNLPL